MRLVALAACLLGVGTTLVLSSTRRGARVPLLARMAPYVPGAGRASARTGVLSVESFRDVVAPLARALGSRAGRLLGVSEELEVRLTRVHSTLDVTAFRIRQLGWVIGTLGVSAAIGLVARTPPALTSLAVLGAPALAFLLVEQQLARDSARWQQRLFLELPVVAEQIGLLLSAGWSLSGAVSRVAERSGGAAGRDLARVTARVRQGVSETTALREWAAIAQVPAVDRLVLVLALNHEAGDLGRLISDEARAIRRDAQRQLVEQIGARAQQVWIPVTVATLVPGVIFIAVPFLQALSLFSTS